MNQQYPVITAEHLRHSFGRGEARVAALDDVSLEIPRGRWTSIMGPSGSGKTTLLHCLSGLERPGSGSIVLNTRSRSTQRQVKLSSLSENARARLRRNAIGVVFQDFNLVPVLSVKDNILLPGRLSRRRVPTARFEEVIEQLGLGKRLRHLPDQLSGGQRQRVAIARTLLMNPEIIFADEPTGSLDTDSGEVVLDLFRKMVDEQGQTLVLVTHDLAAARHGDRLVRMRDGQIIETIEDVRGETTSPAAAAVDGATASLDSLEG